LIASLIIIVLSAVIAVTVLLLYILSRGKYENIIKPLNKKNYAFLFMLPAGLYVLDLLNYSYSEGDRKLRDSFSELYGDKSAMVYLRVHIANKIAAAMIFLFMIGLFSIYLNVQSFNTVSEASPVSINGNLISRPAFNPDTYKNGDASITVQAEIADDGGKTTKTYDINVPMQIPDDKTCVDLVVQDLEYNYIKVKRALFENGISSDLDFTQFGTQLGCNISLVTESEQDYLTEYGELTQPSPDISEPPVLHTCFNVTKGDINKQTYKFDIKVLPSVNQLNTVDELDKAVKEINTHNPDALRNDSIEMPTEIEKSTISWSQAEKPADNSKYIIFIGGLFVVVLLFVVMDSDVDKQIKKKRELIKKDFPEFINKYVLLLGCGLTTYDSLHKIMEDNMNTTKTFDNHPLYTELETTLREVDLGKAEVYAYEDFGLRCRITEAMKFSSLVIQNLRRGTDDLLILLKEQVTDVWQIHKTEVRRKGEEASTKLVFPMILSLVSVLLIVIYPAFSSVKF